jgi:hypothetical protein
MNTVRILLAGGCAFVAYMAVGSVLFVAFPQMKREVEKYRSVYRDHDGIMKMMPVGMVAMLLSELVLAVIWAKMYPAGAGWLQGLEYGALVGVFCVCSFVLHNWVNLNIGAKLMLQQAAAYFLEWTVVGVVIALLYKP